MFCTRRKKDLVLWVNSIDTVANVYKAWNLITIQNMNLVLLSQMLCPVCILKKVAAGTLDASTKIYAVRVDAVHADAYRVLGGLGSETKPGEGECLVAWWLSFFFPTECKIAWFFISFKCSFLFILSLITVCAYTDRGQNEEAEKDDGGGEMVAKQPKKKRPPKRTVEQNLSNINSAESERKCEVWCNVYRKVNGGSIDTNPILKSC